MATPETRRLEGDGKRGAINRAQDVLGRIKRLAATHRTAILIVASLAFAIGTAYSIASLELSWSDISVIHVLLSALVIVPLALVYGAFNFMVMARGAGQQVGFVRALKVSCVAAVAEFLPIPGGALVRGGAMMQQGAGAADATAHVMVNALLWIACAAVAAAVALGFSNPIAALIGVAGLTGVIGCSWWLWRRAGGAIACAALALRLLGLVIAGARILLGFLAIGVAAHLLEIYPFVFAAILGSAASIAPGGLGISELLAAALATLSTFAPQAAFIAVALNRVIGFVVSGAITAILFAAGGLTSTSHEELAP